MYYDEVSMMGFQSVSYYTILIMFLFCAMVAIVLNYTVVKMLAKQKQYEKCVRFLGHSIKVGGWLGLLCYGFFVLFTGAYDRVIALFLVILCTGEILVLSYRFLKSQNGRDTRRSNEFSTEHE